MARSAKPTDTFAAAYPFVARWVNEEEGWFEIGSDEYSTSFVRALHQGGMVWEGEPSYPTMDAAFAALDAGIAEWLEENRPDAVPAKKPARGKGTKNKTGGMTRVPVESSMLTAIGYDEATKELEAVFRSGEVWRYRGVPKKVYRELLASGSKGGYMRDLVIGTYADYRVSR